MNYRKNNLLVLGLILFILLIFSLWDYGYRLSKDQSINSIKQSTNWDVEIKLAQSYKNDNQIALLENKNDGSFGIAKTDKDIGFLWKTNILDIGNIEGNQPFKALGVWIDDVFIIGIKVQNENITYFSVGKGPQISLDSKYNFTFDEVKEMKDIYTVSEVVNNYALFILDDYNESKWTITAFDHEGNLIADKLFGAEERLIIK